MGTAADGAEPAEELAEATRSVDESPTLAATAQTLAHAAVRALPGVDHAAVAVVRDGVVELQVATDDLARTMASAQRTAGDAVQREAMTTARVVVVERAGDQERWPELAGPARRLGVRSHLAVPLVDDSLVVGVLGLYSTTEDLVGPEVRRMSEVLAAHAGVALDRARREEEWREALSSRTMIGQAVGLLMQRHRLDEGHAFAFLTRLSQNSNTKLRDVARDLVRDANNSFTTPPDSSRPG